MTGILIFSIIIVSSFSAYFGILGAKSKLIERTTIEKSAFYFSEKLFETIKKGGNIDYEEYFNRRVRGNSSYMSGHYSLPTGFGNFGHNGILGTSSYGAGHYYCISGNGASNKIGSDGCFNSTKNNISTNVSNTAQRYGQYYLNFIDYNYDYDSDGGDYDGDGNFRGDDDDEFTGEGPIVFTSGTDVKELYLISNDKKTRTFFRWNVKQDPNHPSFPATSCDFSSPETPTGSGCLGTIEFLKLDGKDGGNDHISGNNDSTEYDGVVDTWLINEDFSSVSNVVAGSNNNNYRIQLFPDDINVKDFKLFVYPNKDRLNAWKDISPDVNISPYIKIQMILTPSWKKRAKMKSKIPEIPLNMTISLGNILNNN
ncbi:hypothetical protein CSB07_01375 [Candidatus Gracilibacteria bacterium]|nr:MAG: hypothetical protein CSB07_01375 [Candidatus Gracilibacteria bacterium]PIE85069.1 MAG: hypothetical protein CSA08_03960 [Candidatus Gracilibacteria bacterium]